MSDKKKKKNNVTNQEDMVDILEEVALENTDSEVSKSEAI